VPTFEELLERWDGEQVVIRHDAQSGAWIFIEHQHGCGSRRGRSRARLAAA
jgi:hypothetical protein